VKQEADMDSYPKRVRKLYAIPALLVVIGLLAYGSYTVLGQGRAPQKAKSIRKSGAVLAEVVQASLPGKVQVNPAAKGFTPQVRLGFQTGDQWEPSIAADRFSHIYVLYPQYLGVPGCLESASPAIIQQTSADPGQNWSEPRVV
jgi:hypothetical protein